MNFNIPTAAIHRITFKQETSATKQNRGGSNRSLSTNKAAFERNPESDSFEFSIGYINDTHGQTNNMMRILSGLKGDLKLSAGDNDIGDEKNKNVHKATYKFLNIAGVVASALGNHEMDTTQADLIDSLNGYNGDLLAVNLKKDMLEDQDPNDIAEFGRDHLEEKLKGSKIVEVKGEKVGLIGASPMDMFERLTHGNYH